MRVESLNYDRTESQQFVNFLLSIGNGSSIINDNDNNPYVQIPSTMCVWNLQELIDWVFPHLFESRNTSEIINKRAILSPCNDAIDMINDMIINKIKTGGHAHVYYSSDTIEEEERKYSINQNHA